MAWKLFNSPLVDELICALGNGGTAPLVPAATLELADAVEIARWAFAEGIDMIVPAGSRALHAGLVDEVVALHIGVCGPSQRSAALERSRCQAKEFMLHANLPTPPGRAFTARLAPFAMTSLRKPAPSSPHTDNLRRRCSRPA